MSARIAELNGDHGQRSSFLRASSGRGARARHSSQGIPENSGSRSAVPGAILMPHHAVRLLRHGVGRGNQVHPTPPLPDPGT